jgi:hypothetical protein
MFGADRGNMGVMMADGDGRNTEFFGQPQGQMGRREIGVQVVGDQFGPDVEDAEQVVDCFFEEADGGGVVEAADVLRQEGFAAFHHANRVLQVAAERQHGRAVVGQRNRHRHVAAGAADEGRTFRRRPDHRIVAADDDVAVVDEIGVGDPERRSSASSLAMTSGSPCGLALVMTSSRSLARLQPVGASRAAGGFVPEQQVQRRRRQHDAEPGEAGGDAFQFALALGAENDGGSDALQQACSASPIRAKSASEAAFRPMTAKGFSSRCLRSRSSATAAGCAHRRRGESRPGP